VTIANGHLEVVDGGVGMMMEKILDGSQNSNAQSL